MNRRTVLIGTGIGATIALGGCVSDGDENGGDDGASGDDSDGDDSGSVSPSDSPTYEATAGDVPADRPLKHGLELLHAELRDPERPLVFEISVTNESKETIAYADRRDAIGLFRTAAAFVLMGEDHEGYEFADDWWTATDRFAQTEEYQTEELPPGESRSAQLAVVVQDPEENPEEAPEELQFTLPFRVGTPDTAGCKKMKNFATPGWQIYSRIYSRQYEEVVDTEQEEWMFTLTRTEQ